MSKKKYADDDPKRTLVTLDQLSQTIEVMTSVVNRLRRHLSDQIKFQIEAQEELEALNVTQIESPIQIVTSESDAVTKNTESQQVGREQDRARERRGESFVVEINQQEVDSARKSTKTLH